MSIKLSWQESKNRSLIIVLLGFAAIIQLLIILPASYYFPINSIYIFVFVSLGVILLLTGAEILLAQIIHAFRVHKRQLKPAKKRRKLKKISELWSIFIGAGITLGLFILIYFIFTFFLMDPLSFVFIPVYGKFTLVELFSGIILIIIVLILESVIPQK
ncbi:MAG: hypothetical protein ACFFD2_10910 [Promethearchaeota archaeon]